MRRLLRPIARPAVRAWAAARVRRSGRARRSQLETLRQLLYVARNTRFGRELDFDGILRADDFYARFRERLPLMSYESWVEWLGPLSPVSGDPAPLENQAWPGVIDTFCLSSGTTSGRTKYIPYSPQMIAVNRKAALDFFANIVLACPDVSPPLGKTFYMSGSTNIRPNHRGVLIGDMSALTKYLAPKILTLFTQPPQAVSAMEPWSARLEKMVDICREDPAIAVLSGIPIWQVALLEAVQERTGKPPIESMPGLRAIIHGGMSIAPYRDRLTELTGGRVGFYETYAASEIGIGAFQMPGETGMRFCADYNVFYEFEDEGGNVVCLDGVRTDRPYSVLISSCAGLWRYRIGDVLTFRSTRPHILDYVSRDKTSSAFDEKVSEKQLELAMTDMAPAVGDFAMGPDTVGRRHIWFLATDLTLDGAWLTRLDDNLRALHQDYDDYRQESRIKPPGMVFIRDRAAFLRLIGREEGGQRKFPRILSPEETAKVLKTNHVEKAVG